MASVRARNDSSSDSEPPSQDEFDESIGKSDGSDTDSSGSESSGSNCRDSSSSSSSQSRWSTCHLRYFSSLLDHMIYLKLKKKSIFISCYNSQNLSFLVNIVVVLSACKSSDPTVN